MLAQLRARFPQAMGHGSAPVSSGVAEAGEDPLAAALVCELHTAAIKTAVVMTAIDASARDRLQDPSCLAGFLPHEPSVLRACPGWLADQNIPARCLEGVSRYMSGLRAGCGAVTQFVAEASRAGPERARALHQRRLTSIWVPLCEAAISAVDSVTQLPSLKSVDAQNGRAVIAVLKQARGGQMPCLDAQNRLFLPDLPQRRMHFRRIIAERCTVRARRRSTEGLARDVSIGGLRVECDGSLAAGDVVAIELKSGRQFRGTVSWCRGGREIGIKLFRPLLPNDPLLFG